MPKYSKGRATCDKSLEFHHLAIDCKAILFSIFSFIQLNNKTREISAGLEICARCTRPVCPTVSGQRALRSYSWLTQPSGSLTVRCVKIRYADCHAVSSLSELGNLYRVHGVSL